MIYSRLLQRRRPGTVVEIGTLDGGSALWFADQMACFGLAPRVVSIDKAPPALDDARITFLKADALDIAAGVGDFPWQRCPHPWLVVEDSAHTADVTAAALRYFDPLLVAGDFLVVEDGVVRDLPEAVCRRYEDGPNRAVAEFLAARRGAYETDRDSCDFFGPNFTWNPGGYLRRTGGT